MPKNNQDVDLFARLVRAGFDPIKDMIDYGELDLSAQDVAKITQAIEGGLNNWVQFVKMNKQKSDADPR